MKGRREWLASVAGCLILAGVAVWAADVEPGRSEPVQLQDISVKAPADGMDEWSGRAEAPGSFVAGGPGVLLRTQGGQGDLSVRGSSFSEAGLAVGGLALRNPQTEHFHAELPLPAGLFQPPTVLTGLEQALGSSAHLAGTVDLDFAPFRPGGHVRAGASERGGNRQDGAWRLDGEGPELLRYGVGVFAGREILNGVDYPDNDLERTAGGAHLQVAGSGHQTDLAIGSQNKTFGARGYYGVNPEWPSEERLEDDLLLAGTRWGDMEGRYVRGMALWRTLRDRYRLELPASAPFENRHRTVVGSAGLDGREPLLDSVFLVWRVGVEQEAIRSNGLGNHDRSRGHLLLAPEWRAGRATLRAGVRQEVFSEGQPATLPIMGAAYRAGDRAVVFASYTGGIREPSYTELNYESPGSLGRQGLEREECRNAEAGWRLDGRERDATRLTLFQRETDNTVDWVKAEESSPRWVATDLGTVRTRGVEVNDRRKLPGALEADGGLTWIDKEYDGTFHAGRYVLDYSEWTLQLGLEWQATDGLRLGYRQDLTWQADLPARDDDERLGMRGRATMEALLPWPAGVRLELACDNVWDDRTEVFIGQPVAGRMFSGGIVRGW